MRVSTATHNLNTQLNLGNSLSRYETAQVQMSTGKRVTKWSDDPAAAAQATKVRALEKAHASWTRAGEDAGSRLDTADDALQSMSTLLIRAKSLAVSAVNGSLSAEARAAVADELDGIAGSVKDSAQASYLGTPVFGGTADAALSTASGTPTWVGDNNPMLRQIGPDTTIDASVDGETLLGFGTAGADVFSQLAALSTAVRANDAAGIATGQQNVDAAHTRVLTAIGKVGADQSRVDAAQARSGVATTALASQRAALEEVSLPSAVLALQNAQTSYQAALGAAAKADLPSLVDFLR